MANPILSLWYITDMAIMIGDFATAAQAAQEKAEIDLSRCLPIDQAYGLYSVAVVNLALFTAFCPPQRTCAQA